MLEQLLSRLTSCVEVFFPLVPVVGPRQNTSWQEHLLSALGDVLLQDVVGPRQNTSWQEPSVYYFTDDPSLRLRQRWTAILKLDRKGVSFWRRRTAYMRNPLRGRDYV